MLDSMKPADTAKRVLVVDDEEQIGSVLRTYLEREGFEAIVRTDVRGAISALASARPDLMILDITLPDGSGLDILKAGTKPNDRIPAIMLTARADEVDRIVGLELGADDYITKPFSPREVIARVRAVFRRVGETGESPQAIAPRRLRVGDVEIDTAAHEVRVKGKIANLTPSEFRILSVLMESPGQVYTRAQLLDRLGDDGSIFERTLDRHINNLRRKIEPVPEDPTYILTVYGVGYKMKRD
ncbi:MAG: response regulator transcription factor [Vulcanimicrobiaceae bacterium]